MRVEIIFGFCGTPLRLVTGKRVDFALWALILQTIFRLSCLKNVTKLEIEKKTKINTISQPNPH